MTSKEYIAAIENVLWIENADCAFLNPKDYMNHFLLFSRKRFEPNTETKQLRVGWIGSYGLFEEPGFWCAPKPIYIQRDVPEGTMLGANLPTEWKPIVEVKP